MGAYDQFEGPPTIDKPPKRVSEREKERQAREEAAISLQDIFKKFSKTRQHRKDRAYRELQQDLSDNASVLIMSGQITMKEIVATITELEEYLQGEELPEGDDPITFLSKWLRGENPGDEFDKRHPGANTPVNVSSQPLPSRAGANKVTPISAAERQD